MIQALPSYPKSGFDTPFIVIANEIYPKSGFDTPFIVIANEVKQSQRFRLSTKDL